MSVDRCAVPAQLKKIKLCRFLNSQQNFQVCPKPNIQK